MHRRLPLGLSPFLALRSPTIRYIVFKYSIYSRVTKWTYQCITSVMCLPLLTSFNLGMSLYMMQLICITVHRCCDGFIFCWIRQKGSNSIKFHLCFWEVINQALIFLVCIMFKIAVERSSCMRKVGCSTPWGDILLHSNARCLNFTGYRRWPRNGWHLLKVDVTRERTLTV